MIKLIVCVCGKYFDWFLVIVKICNGCRKMILKLILVDFVLRKVDSLF